MELVPPLIKKISIKFMSSEFISKIEEKMRNDTYLEHEFHIVGETGKRVPFWKNKANCSICYANWRKITDESRIWRQYYGTNREPLRDCNINILGNPNF